MKPREGGGLMGRLVCALATGAALLAGLSAAAAESEHTSLAIPGTNVLFLAQYVATDMHFWERQGLDVTVQNIIGIGAMNAVISGSMDFSMSSGASISRAALRGQRLVALATAISEAGQAIVIRKDIADAAHFDPLAPLAVRAQILKGRTIAIGGVGAIPDVLLKVVAHEAGIAPNDMVVAPLQPPEFMAAFARKAIDGFSNSPPFVQQVVADGTGVAITDMAKGEPTEYSPVAAAVLLTRADFCAGHRDICRKMVQGVVEAIRFIRSDRARTVAIMKAHFGTYADPVLEASYVAMAAMTSDPPVTTVKELENGDLMNAVAGFIKPEEKLSRYDDLIDNEFIK
jgi:ABC-type nitrate/sulfonate/bicarbonate transport system substrate-binding protein